MSDNSLSYDKNIYKKEEKTYCYVKKTAPLPVDRALPYFHPPPLFQGLVDD
jgi:hypothetical protein